MASLYDGHYQAQQQPPKLSSTTSAASTSVAPPSLNIPSSSNSQFFQVQVPKTDLPISTPRRRLRDALSMEKQICEQLLQTGWTLVVRAGKKIDGRYGLVSAYAKYPDVRVTIYQTQKMVR